MIISMKNRITNEGPKETFVFPHTNDHIYKYATQGGGVGWSPMHVANDK